MDLVNFLGPDTAVGSQEFNSVLKRLNNIRFHFFNEDGTKYELCRCCLHHVSRGHMSWIKYGTLDLSKYLHDLVNNSFYTLPVVGRACSN